MSELYSWPISDIYIVAYDILESNILALKYLNHLTTFQLAKYFLSSSIPFFQWREGWEGNFIILLSSRVLLNHMFSMMFLICFLIVLWSSHMPCFPCCSHSSPCVPCPNYCSFSLQRWWKKWEKYISSLGRVQFWESLRWANQRGLWKRDLLTFNKPTTNS